MPRRKKSRPIRKKTMTTWLQHVKKVHASGSTSFKESLKRASKSWKSAKGAKPKKKGKASKVVEDDEKVSTEEPAAAPAPKARKKKRRLRPKSGPKVSGKAYKSVDSVGL